MSARWRRSKRNPERFNILKNVHKVGKKKNSRRSRKRSPWIMRQRCITRSSVLRIDEDRAREPEPLIDVLEGEQEVTVFAELAGFSKEDLRINVKNRRLTLSAQRPGRRYYKSLNLPKRVIADTIHTKYKNGVLEVHLRKTAEEKPIDKAAG